MKKFRNLGHTERVIRVGTGLLLLALSGFSLFLGWGDLFLIILGIVFLLTGIIGYCPAWQLMRIRTWFPHHPSSFHQQEQDHDVITPSTHRS